MFYSCSRSIYCRWSRCRCITTILIHIYIYCRCETGWSKNGVDIDPSNPNYYTNICIVDVRQDGVRME